MEAAIQIAGFFREIKKSLAPLLETWMGAGHLTPESPEISGIREAITGNGLFGATLAKDKGLAAQS
jgi:hypothetical protein